MAQKVNQYLTIENFYSYSGISINDINDNYLDYLIRIINQTIKTELGSVFSFARGHIVRYRVENANTVFIVGPWQVGGGVDSITVTNGGNGYDDTTTVTFDGGDAVATPVIVDGVVTRIDIIYQGRNYAIAPTVTIDGIGSDAAAIATISPELTVRRGEEDDTELIDLVKGEDYKEIFLKDNEPQRQYPVVCISLMDDYISQHDEFLEIEGTFGYSDIVPDELFLEPQLYALLKDIVLKDAQNTSTGGGGTITSSKIDRVQINFSTEGQVAAQFSTHQLIRGINDIIKNIKKNSDYFVDRNLLPVIMG